jgi:hypothetical protein
VTNSVECESHGTQEEAFVCQHIANSLQTNVPVGFFWSNEPDTARPDAWCEECNERVNRTNAEWVGEAEEHLAAKLLCGMCYDIAKRLCLGSDT